MITSTVKNPLISKTISLSGLLSKLSINCKTVNYNMGDMPIWNPQHLLNITGVVIWTWAFYSYLHPISESNRTCDLSKGVTSVNSLRIIRLHTKCVTHTGHLIRLRSCSKCKTFTLARHTLVTVVILLVMKVNSLTLTSWLNEQLKKTLHYNQITTYM